MEKNQGALECSSENQDTGLSGKYTYLVYKNVVIYQENPRNYLPQV